MFERRLQVLLLFLALFCLVLGLRAVALQVFQKSTWETEAAKNLISKTQIPSTRGRILDVKGRELAVDQPCIDACVDYHAIAASPTTDWGPTTDAGRWLRAIARGYLREQMDYDNPDLRLADKKKLLADECDKVKLQMNAMWHDLAVLSHKSDDEIDDIRRDIVRRVETQRRLVWYHKYQSAATTQPTERRWYDWLVGNSSVDIDKFDVHVAEESQPQVVLPNIDYDIRSELNRNIDKYPGLLLREGVIRMYPYGSIACQTIGRVARVTPDDIVKDPMIGDAQAKYDASDEIGRDGMEKLFEPQLRGRRGEHFVDELGSPKPDVPPEAGHDVQTTIDVDLQQEIEQAFKKVDFAVNNQLKMEQLDMPGAAVVIDVPTGQVRALVSWPTYDLNHFDDLYSKISKDAINQPLMNRATLMAVEPGSTVKPMVGIGAITAGIFRPDETIPCNGYLVIGNHTFTTWGKCWTMEMYKSVGGTHMALSNPPASPYLTFPEALERSCNVFHETLANRLGLDGLSHWFKTFGLGQETGIGLDEAKGLLPNGEVVPAAKRLMQTCTAGIGEGHVAATPIQMANVAATIARNGIWMRPTVSVDASNERVDLHLNPQAVVEAQEGMRMVVNAPGGTGRTIYRGDLMVSGKTGSAQTSAFTTIRRDDKNQPLRDENGRIIHDLIPLGHYGDPDPIAPWYRAIGDNQEKVPAHGWMIGFAPSDHPKIAFAVLVEYGGGGGSAAGSVVRQILDACIEHGYLAANEK